MSKAQNDFFDEPKPWSRVKNDLLHSYLVPYFTIITRMPRPTYYVDCFAGQGCFKNGEDGSPFLALKARREAMNKNPGQRRGWIEVSFIESEHAKILSDNLVRCFPGESGYSVEDGAFEEKVLPLVSQHTEKNLFLYLDPFGIKSLRFGVFEALTKFLRFPSIEILMNFNSFGFIRAAMSILAKDGQVTSRWDSEQLNAHLNSMGTFDATLSSIEDLNAVAHGTYWIQILQHYAGMPRGFKEAEKEFSEAYRAELSRIFRYVLRMPIGKKDGKTPEYCMFFMTNHPKGCCLMANNMMKRSEYLRLELHNAGQMDLFSKDVDSQLVDESSISAEFAALIREEANGAIWRGPEELMAMYFSHFGVKCKTATLNTALGALEKAGKIFVVRTGKDGLPSASKSFDERNQAVKIAWKGG